MQTWTNPARNPLRLALPLAAALACLGPWGPAPAPVHADSASDLSLTLERGDEEPLALAGSASLKLTLRNGGTRTLPVVPLLLDYNSVSLRVEPEALPEGYYVTRFHPSVYQMQPPDRVLLKPGDELSTRLAIPLVFAGAVQVVAKYNGLSDGLVADTVSSNTLTLQVQGEHQRLAATLATGEGTVTLDLYPQTAPATVMNFVDLANRGFYDGLLFHRVIAGFMIQGGDPDGNGSGGPGYTIPAEFNARKHLKGTLSMARSQSPHSAGSQFYICLEPQPNLDNGYTVFGGVRSGQEVVDAIGGAETGEQNRPVKDQRIVKLRVAAVDNGPSEDEPARDGQRE